MFFHLFNQALLFLHKEINTLLELTTVFCLTSRVVEDINYPFSFCTLLVSWFWELKNNLFWDIALQEKQIISGQANEEVPIVISQENQPSIQISWGILQRPPKLPSTLLLVRHSSGQPKLGSISVSGQLPTYPSPNPTTVYWWQVRVNVGLGEG